MAARPDMPENLRGTVIKYMDFFIHGRESVSLVRQWLEKGYVFLPGQPDAKIAVLNKR